jgi:tetratricopeptide (TPR) repeat protein
MDKINDYRSDFIRKYITLTYTYIDFYNETSINIVYNLFKNDVLSTNIINDSNIFVYYAIYYDIKNMTDKKLEHLNSACSLNNSYAINNLGFHYQDTKPCKAFDLYQTAYKLGNIDAINNIAHCYSNGYGVKNDPNTAIEWYIKAIDHGHFKAINNLGNHYYKYAYSNDQYYKKAVECYRKGITLNNVCCTKNLAECYYLGHGVTQDYMQAFNLFREAADKGNKIAQQYVGECYKNGYGIEVNYFEAIRYYKLCECDQDVDIRNLLFHNINEIIVSVDAIEKENEELMLINEHLKYFPGSDFDQAEYDFSLSNQKL